MNNSVNKQSHYAVILIIKFLSLSTELGSAAKKFIVVLCEGKTARKYRKQRLKAGT